MEVRLEFTVEPFLEGSPGPHVRAAVDEARRQGLDPDVGPFGTTVDGEAAQLLPGLGAIVGAAVDAGASRVALAVSRRQAVPSHPFLEALVPLAEALDAQVIPNGDLAPGDIPLAFDGEILAGIRLPRARGMLDRLVAEVERELGGKLADLNREDKQRAVKLLNDRGAFSLRRSVEDVADALGVSRITVYNYLNAVTRQGG
ncbi:MAG: helix-turn-helix domain-containing protein [Actinomycetota bacterium]|nr:helix-turn-helix domain-containing protein [Actinomycetota bacterium]MDQ6947064.1 helix-turn-helix domain-containing protein [Actinomycetota bacterium]